MKYNLFIVPALILLSLSSFSQRIPEGYLLQYQQNFSSGKALADFRLDNPLGWSIFKANNEFYLRCSAAKSVSSLPANLAILNNKIFGDFILEADVMPGKDSSGILEICLFLGIKDSSTYYFIQLASQSDSLHYGIFLVKNLKIKHLSAVSEPPMIWNEHEWYKIRLERNIVRRTIRVFVNNMTTPLLQIKDYELVMGSVGLGTFASSGCFDNIKIWAPTVISE